MPRWSPTAARSRTKTSRWRLRKNGSVRQRLLQVRNNIFLVLDADRQPHHVGTGAGLHLLRVAQLAVRGRGRVDDQRASVADIGEMREQLHVGDEFYAGVVAALEPEREYRTGAARAVFLREVVVAVAGQARIAHPRHL